jgi:hypothetical protein
MVNIGICVFSLYTRQIEMCCRSELDLPRKPAVSAFEIGKAIHSFIDRLVSQFSTSEIEQVIIETQFCFNPRTLSLASDKEWDD